MPRKARPGMTPEVLFMVFDAEHRMIVGRVSDRANEARMAVATWNAAKRRLRTPERDHITFDTSEIELEVVYLKPNALGQCSYGCSFGSLVAIRDWYGIVGSGR